MMPTRKLAIMVKILLMAVKAPMAVAVSFFPVILGIHALLIPS
ncbi:MAG: hypothetical protein PHR81_01610 [Bacteroidales bacterium]|nr:hypothetical protein [Bacteroidales bacterium]